MVGLPTVLLRLDAAVPGVVAAVVREQGTAWWSGSRGQLKGVPLCHLVVVTLLCRFVVFTPRDPEYTAYVSMCFTAIGAMSLCLPTPFQACVRRFLLLTVLGTCLNAAVSHSGCYDPCAQVLLRTTQVYVLERRQRLASVAAMLGGSACVCRFVI